MVRGSYNLEDTMTDGRRLLVIDDDTELCDLLRTYLKKADFAIDCKNDGQSGLDEALSGNYEIVVLDVMLPGLNGFDVLKQLRHKSDVPVIMLTARDEDVDRIVGLELGADDYLPKPFNPRELVARIEAVLRRTGRTGERDENEILKVGDVTIDPGTREVFKGDEPVELTTTEFALLKVLLESAGKVVKREELSSKGLGRNLTRFDRSIDVHVSKLRRKLGGNDPEALIRTIRGIGYQYVVSRAS